MVNEAFVTLVTTESYAKGAVVLAQSLRKHNTSKHIACLITPNIEPSAREILSNVMDSVIEVNLINSTSFHNLNLLGRPDLVSTLTKLGVWKQTQFQKIVFMDADTMVLRNVDELFQYEDLSAAPDIGWPDCFNSGVFVCKPSNDTFENLKQLLESEGTFDGGDQGILNQYFKNWNRIPFIFNVTPSSFYSYLPAFVKYRNDIAVVHFIGKDKPWTWTRFSSGDVRPRGDCSEFMVELVQNWWNTHDEVFGFSHGGDHNIATHDNSSRYDANFSNLSNNEKGSFIQLHYPYFNTMYDTRPQGVSGDGSCYHHPTYHPGPFSHHSHHYQNNHHHNGNHHRGGHYEHHNDGHNVGHQNHHHRGHDQHHKGHHHGHQGHHHGGHQGHHHGGYQGHHHGGQHSGHLHYNGGHHHHGGHHGDGGHNHHNNNHQHQNHFNGSHQQQYFHKPQRNNHSYQTHQNNYGNMHNSGYENIDTRSFGTQTSESPNAQWNNFSHNEENVSNTKMKFNLFENNKLPVIENLDDDDEQPIIIRKKKILGCKVKKVKVNYVTVTTTTSKKGRKSPEPAKQPSLSDRYRFRPNYENSWTPPSQEIIDALLSPKPLSEGYLKQVIAKGECPELDMASLRRRYNFDSKSKWEAPTEDRIAALLRPAPLDEYLDSGYTTPTLTDYNYNYGYPSPCMSLASEISGFEMSENIQDGEEVDSEDDNTVCNSVECEQKVVESEEFDDASLVTIVEQKV